MRRRRSQQGMAVCCTAARSESGRRQSRLSHENEPIAKCSSCSPWDAATMIVLVAVCVPPPQVAEHVDQALQADCWQLTGHG